MHTRTRGTYLVIGGSGYVGAEIVRQLRAAGVDVTVLDLQRTDQQAPFLKANITSASNMARVLKGRTFDYFLYLAALPGDTGNPRQMVRVNVAGCVNVLECARKMKPKRVVLTSSVCAYGWYPTLVFKKPERLPVDEKHPCNPQEMYGTTKRMQELLALTYHHQFGVITTILRPTVIIGPPLLSNVGARGWRKIIKTAEEGKEVRIPQLSEKTIGHFVDVRDVARMHTEAAHHPGAVGEIFNCCGPTPTSGRDLVDAIREQYPKASVRFEFPPSDAETKTGYPWSPASDGQLTFDMSKARRIMGFEARYSIADTIRATREWIKTHGLD